jgi:hypothetical protein
MLPEAIANAKLSAKAHEETHRIEILPYFQLSTTSDSLQ